MKMAKATDTYIDTLLSFNLHWHRDTLLSGDVLTDLLALVVAIFALKVDDTAFYINNGLALLLIGSFQGVITTCVKSCHALGLNLSCEGVLVDGLTLGVLHLLAVFGETGHLLHNCHRFVSDLTAAVWGVASALLFVLFGYLEPKLQRI